MVDLKETKGLVAKIWTDKSVFRIGEQIPVHYQIKNVSTNTQILWHSGFWPNHKIVVLDNSGRELVTDSTYKCWKDKTRSFLTGWRTR